MADCDVKVGFSRVVITPPLGSNIHGYYHQRLCEGVLDDLEVNAVAVSKNGNTVVLFAIDCEASTTEYCELVRNAVSKATGLPTHAIYMHSTHTHVGPCLGYANASQQYVNDIDREYYSYTVKKIVDACTYAINDLKPAKMGIAVSKAERVGFNRRYLMKDGSTKTNPGVNNPDIVRSIGLLDERVNVIRFVRECGDNIVIGNYGNHPDVIGNNLISADWLGFARRTFEKAVDNTKCVFFNGAQGDINHVNVKPVGGDLNGMFNDFDDVTRGYAHSRHIGFVIAGAMMSVYEKVEFIPVVEVKSTEVVISVASNMPKPEDMEEAYYVQKMVDEGRRNELPYTGMMLTTVMADAARKIRLEHGPEFFPMNLNAIKIGSVAFMGIPGEPFTGVGIGLKETEGYKMVCPTCLTNGSRGYFPMKDSYDEGGYEARSSNYKAGVAETTIEEGVKI
ncbi:MAG: neutral/alkaline non-lysosomal ceramidase N-terminal domain-containing protein, partial [Clostridia bacterium]|nr:neutral/alkaline non-lysosomal ceramidase N-terminal domain-containing protein [Clostridia bacterium]